MKIDKFAYHLFWYSFLNEVSSLLTRKSFGEIVRGNHRFLRLWHKTCGAIQLCILVNKLHIHKPGLHISRKDRRHRLKKMFFKLSRYDLVSIGSNDFIY